MINNGSFNGEGKIGPLGSVEGLTGRFTCDRLKKKLFDTIDNFEEDITYNEVIGVLECMKHQYIRESYGNGND